MPFGNGYPTDSRTAICGFAANSVLMLRLAASGLIFRSSSSSSTTRKSFVWRRSRNGVGGARPVVLRPRRATVPSSTPVLRRCLGDGGVDHKVQVWRMTPRVNMRSDVWPRWHAVETVWRTGRASTTPRCSAPTAARRTRCGTHHAHSVGAAAWRLPRHPRSQSL